MFDLQGYSQSDISDSFIFDHAIPFHLTELNVEDFESLEDIWSTILDERVLVKLEEKVNEMQELILEESRPKPVKQDDDPSKTPELSSSHSETKKKDLVAPESPSNFKLIDGTIKSQGQRDLYKLYMAETKARNKGLKFELMRAQVPLDDTEEEPVEESDNQDQIIPEESTDKSKSVVDFDINLEMDSANKSMKSIKSLRSSI